MALTHYINEIKQRAQTLFAEKKPQITTHRCCIQFSKTEVSLIHINNTQDTLEILYADTFPFDDFDHLPLVLSGIVEKNNLNAIPTYWLLSPDDYQFFVIESLPVEKTEFDEALKWRIRSLISYPPEEATIDYFLLPMKKAASNNPMIAAVTAKMDQLTPTINVIKKSGLTLTTIDIPEMALRNLTALYENDEKSTAFIYFYDNITVLNITRQKTLYFSRHLAVPNQPESPTINYELLSLEILRYFDYFQTQWRYPNPSRVFIASEKENAAEIAKNLSEHLTVSAEPFSLKIILDEEKKILVEKKYLLSLGSALREERYAAPGN